MFATRLITPLLCTAFALSFGLSFCSSSVQAGTIRHDVADVNYTSLASNAKYAAVGEFMAQIGGSWYRGSGTLISSQWILTAAHVVENATTVQFTTSTGSTQTADSYIVHTSWTGNLQAGWDMALVHLPSAVVGITPASLYASTDEVSQTITMVGYGKTGTGTTGDTLASGTRRAEMNVIDGVGGGVVGSLNLAGWSSNLIFSDFDNPAGTESLMGSNIPLALEGSIAPGDSGGGTFVDISGSTYLVGVHSLGASIDGQTNSDYGDIFASTRVSQFLTWIQNNSGVTAGGGGGGGGGGAPEPKYLFFLSFLAILGYCTHRRKHS